MSGQEIMVQNSKPLAVAEMKEHVALIQSIMKGVMRDGEHYGTIPGCGDKPSLLQPGAQKLILTFRLVPDPEVETIELAGEHREYRVKVKMYDNTGVFLGAGVGSCSTMESKFRFRKSDLTCPDCGAPAIIKGKAEFGGGWICYQKKGGCGKKWTDESNPFHGHVAARVEHDNPADYYNTCEKMAFKRALVSATLTVTAASDIFTQDVEEMVENGTIPSQSNQAQRKPPVKQPQERRESAPNSEKEATIKDPDAAITDPQIKAIGALLSKLGIQDDYARHEKVSNILALDNVIDSMRSLKKGQASEVIQALQTEANG